MLNAFVLNVFPFTTNVFKYFVFTCGVGALGSARAGGGLGGRQVVVLCCLNHDFYD